MAELTLWVDVAAPPQDVWDAAVDWDRQHEWMVGTTARGGHGLGATLVARTEFFGVGFDDPMTITTWDPPHRCVVRHEGKVVRGTAAFEVLPLDDGHARFVWTEWLVLPFGWIGEIGFALLEPLIVIPLRRSLEAFSTRGIRAAP